MTITLNHKQKARTSEINVFRMHEQWQSLDIFENLMLCFPSIFRVMYTWAKAPHFLPKMQKLLPKNHNQDTLLFCFSHPPVFFRSPTFLNPPRCLLATVTLRLIKYVESYKLTKAQLSYYTLFHKNNFITTRASKLVES